MIIHAERIDLQEIFSSVDADDNGKLSFEESLNLLPKIEKRLKATISDEDKSDAKKYFDSVDSNSDGSISRSEFKTAVREKLSKVMGKYRNQL